MQIVRVLGGLLTVSAALVLVGVSGCSPRPWQGVDARAFGKLETHRLLGIAYLENTTQTAEALAEFRAIQKEQPGLAWGYAAEAAALAQNSGTAASALKPAQKAAELLPQSGWIRLILAKAYERSGQPDKVVASLDEALKLEPNNARLVGGAIKQLEFLPGEHAARVYELRKRLAELAPDNLVAQDDLLKAQIEQKEFAGAAATLEKIVRILPQLPAQSEESLPVARKGLAAGAPEAVTAARVFSNLYRQSARYGPDGNVIYGAAGDAADLLMREWNPPPPVFTPPALAPAAVTWKDVTQPMALDGLVAPGLAPAAVGDVDMSPDAGQWNGSSTAPLQGKPDLVVGPSPLGLLFNKEDGYYPGTRGAAAPASPLFADFNNDFALDLYSVSPTGDQLWINPRPGDDDTQTITFPAVRSQAMRPGAPPPGKGAGAPAVVDLDQDGDVDILRPSIQAGQPAVRYLRNNGNFTFTDLTAASGLMLPSAGARQAVFGDFDNDLDPDVFVVRAEGPSQLFLNRRQDRFANASTAWGIKSDAGALSADVADFDRDGNLDIAVAGKAPHGTLIYRNGGKQFQPDAAAIPLPAGFQAEWVRFLDFDNDTWLDLAVAGSGGVLVFKNEGGKLSQAATVLDEPSRWLTTLDYDQDGDLDLLIATRANHLRLFSNEGGNARPWMKLELHGYQSKGTDPQANNTFGIGAQVEAVTVWDRQKILVTEPVTHIGLGRADRALAARVLWPHGVPQDLINPESAVANHYRQKPTGSCPFIYAFHNGRWEFMGDFNWRSPLGMLQGRGKPVPHGLTQDWLRLPGDRVEAQDGLLHLIATEELREVSYFDQIKLLAVDHPIGTEVYVDERFPFGPPNPFRIYTVRNPRLPVSARDQNGADLLPALKAVDTVYTPVPRGYERGVCAPHELILDLGRVPDPKNVRLFLNGWIYPAANSTNVAVSQNPDVKVIPPTLAFGDGRGGWTHEDGSVGLPCGKRKTVVLDLSNRFVANDFRIKLTTTMEIRWDAAFYTSGETPVGLREHAVPLLTADLRERGVGENYREVEDGPDLYDYNRLLPPSRQPDWRPITGDYTRLGDCSPLLHQVDDRYAIVAPGDEIRLAFDGRRLPAPAAGWKRDYILLTDGWTKDADPNTVTGETVGPLPFHGMKRYPYGPEEQFPDTPAHQAWRKEWNTRHKGE